MKVYEIDGGRFATLEEFAREFSRVVLNDEHAWGGKLDAFDDILRGGFGTPEDGFLFRWRNHEASRKRLGYPETVRQLELRLQRCHPENREHVALELAEARAERGPTVYDWLVEIIRSHGVGDEREDGVELELA